MKTFQWKYLTPLGSGRVIASLLEIKDERRGRICASVVQDGDAYRPIVSGQTVDEDLNFKDAKDAVEKRLFDEGVIHKGDTIEDYT